MSKTRFYIALAAPLLATALVLAGCGKKDGTTAKTGEKSSAALPPAQDPKSVPAEKKAEAAKIVAAADKLRAEFNYPAARTKYLEAAKIDPSNIKARLGTELAAVSAENARRAAGLMDAAYKARAEKKILETHRLAMEARALDPNNDDALDKAAVSAGMVRRFNVARELFEEIARRNPGTLKPLLQLAETCYSQGDYAACVDYMSRVEPLLDAEPRLRDNPEIWLMKGIACRRRSLMPDSIAALQRAVRLRPDDPRYHDELGRSLLEEGQYDLAIRTYSDLVRLRPTVGEHHYHLGLAYQRNGALDKAIDAFKAAVRHDSLNFNFYVSCARAHESLGDKENLGKAIGYLEQALHVNPLSHEALLTYSNVMRKLGDGTTADDYLDRYNAVFAIADRQTERLRVINRTLRDQPNAVELHLERILIQIQFQHWIEAEEYCQELLLVDPKNKDALEHLARLLFMKKDFGGALCEAEKLKEAAPNDHRGHLLAASSLLSLNDRAGALANAERANELAPMEFGPIEILVQLYRQMPEKAERLQQLMPTANELYKRIMVEQEAERRKQQELLDVAQGRKKAK